MPESSSKWFSTWSAAPLKMAESWDIKPLSSHRHPWWAREHEVATTETATFDSKSWLPETTPMHLLSQQLLLFSCCRVLTLFFKILDPSICCNEWDSSDFDYHLRLLLPNESKLNFQPFSRASQFVILRLLFFTSLLHWPRKKPANNHGFKPLTSCCPWKSNYERCW